MVNSTLKKTMKIEGAEGDFEDKGRRIYDSLKKKQKLKHS